jgi:hypothetical protein
VSTGADKQGLGDIIEALVKPLARALGLSCLDQDGNLRPESGCAKRRDRINRRVKLPKWLLKYRKNT